MLPSLESYLDTVAETLEELIIPAIDPSERHVIEQAHLAIASLRFAASRLPEATRFTYRTVEALIGDVEEGCELAQDSETRAKAQELVDRARRSIGPCPARTENLDALRAELRTMMARLVSEATLEGKTLSRFNALERKHTLLARVWAAPAGFDAEADDLPDVADLLDAPIRDRPGDH